jgi:hypothetical protein
LLKKFFEIFLGKKSGYNVTCKYKDNDSDSFAKKEFKNFLETVIGKKGI